VSGAGRATAIGLLSSLLGVVTPVALSAQTALLLPSGVTVTPPGPAIPKSLVKFSGKWLGTWGSRDVILVFERIETGPDRATVVYAWGPRSASATAPAAGPGWRRLKGTFVGGGAFQVVLDDTARVFRLGPDDTLVGTWSPGGPTDRVTLRRMAD
jgi:hypothetical protein